MGVSEYFFDDQEREEKSDRTLALPGRNGRGDTTVATEAWSDRPVLSQGRQRPPGVEKMLSIYFLRLRSNLSDRQAEDAIYDNESMRRCAKVELGDEILPGETSILPVRSTRRALSYSGASI